MKVAIPAIATLLAIPSAAHAGSKGWAGGGATSNWSNTANWFLFDGPAPTGGDSVYFTGVRAQTTSTVNQDYQLGALDFIADEFDVESSWTINAIDGKRIRMNGGVRNRTNKTQNINVPLIFLNDYAISNKDGDDEYGRINLGDIGLNAYRVFFKPSLGGIYVNGSISDAGSINVDGSGSLTLSSASSFTGGVSLTNGTLRYSAGDQLGKDGVSFRNQTNSYATLASTASLTNTRNVWFDSGEGRIDVAADTIAVYSGGFYGPGVLAKQGAGMLVLSGQQGHNGRTDVREGNVTLIGSYYFSGSDLNISAGASVTYDNGHHDGLGVLTGAGTLFLGDNQILQLGLYNDADNIGTFTGVIAGNNAQLVKVGRGTLTLRGASTFTGTLDIAAGTLRAGAIANGASSTGAAYVIVRSGATLGGGGNVLGNVEVASGGRISPSSPIVNDSIGTLVVKAITLRQGSTLAIDVPPVPIALDVLVVREQLNLEHATLALNVTPTTGNAIRRAIVLNPNGRSGVFGTITGLAVGDGRSWAVTYEADGIYAQPALPGDATLNGRSDFDDLLSLAKRYGREVDQTWVQGDFDGNGATNFDDLLILARHFNRTTPLTAAQISALPNEFVGDWALAVGVVPEPASVAVGAGALALAAGRRVRRAR